MLLLLLHISIFSHIYIIYHFFFIASTSAFAFVFTNANEYALDVIIDSETTTLSILEFDFKPVYTDNVSSSFRSSSLFLNQTFHYLFLHKFYLLKAFISSAVSSFNAVDKLVLLFF